MLFSSNTFWIASDGRVRIAKYLVGGFDTNTVSMFIYFTFGMG